LASFSSYGFLLNPKVLLGIVAAVVLVVFRNQVSGALKSYGGGLGSFGSGIQSFISSVGSPSIQPTIGLKLGGVFGDIQAGINDWYNDTYRKGNSNSTNTTSAPHSTGGMNISQSTSESGGDRQANILRNLQHVREAYRV
jgi:hypothetical protein